MPKVNGERQVGAAKAGCHETSKTGRRCGSVSWHCSAGEPRCWKSRTGRCSKSAGERTRRISELERELQQAGEALKWLGAEVERLKADVERLKGEREFYHKRVLALEQDNHDLAGVATKYSLWGQKLERELA
jgi:hypothetical protein